MTLKTEYASKRLENNYMKCRTITENRWFQFDGLRTYAILIIIANHTTAFNFSAA